MVLNRRLVNGDVSMSARETAQQSDTDCIYLFIKRKPNWNECVLCSYKSYKTRRHKLNQNR